MTSCPSPSTRRSCCCASAPCSRTGTTSRSKIRVRLYSWQPDTPLDQAFFRQKIEAALRLRRDVLRRDGPGRGCRLVFSEGDGLSGLTVDRYDGWLAVQITSLGIARRRE